MDACRQMRLQGSHESTIYEDIRPETFSPTGSVYNSGALLVCGNFSSRTDSDCSDYFVKTVRVYAIEHGDWQVARATFDTGSIHNWVSKTYLIERLRFPLTQLSHEQKRLCVAFNGALVSPIGAVQLTWYSCSTHGRKSCVSTFFVADEEVQLFDILIGSKTIVKERILTWDVGAVWTLLSTPLGGKKEREKVERQTEIIASNRQPLIDESDRCRNEYRARKRRLLEVAYNQAVQPPSSLQDTALASRSEPAARRRDEEQIGVGTNEEEVAQLPSALPNRRISRSARGRRPVSPEPTIPEIGPLLQPIQHGPEELTSPSVRSSSTLFSLEAAQQNLNAAPLQNPPQPSASADREPLAILERVSSRGLNTQPSDPQDQELPAAIPLPDQSTGRYPEAARQAQQQSRGMRPVTRPSPTDRPWQRRRRQYPIPAQEMTGAHESQDPPGGALPNGVVPPPKGMHKLLGKLFHKKT